MNGYMVTVKYEVYKNEKLVLKNIGYFESKESAKKTLERQWKGCDVFIF